MGMLQAVMMPNAGPYVNPLPGGTVTNGIGDTALLNVNTDGTITFNNPTTTQNWYLPTTTGVGTGHYVRFVVTSGDALNVGSSSYVEISQQRSAGFNTELAQSAEVRVDIASDSGGTNVVCSGSYTINRTV